MDRAAKLAGWFGKLGGWALSLGKTLGGALMSGARLAGQAVLWLGRAFLMNPIGLAITGIALGAYLIYRYWKPIKAFFLGLWSEVRAAFAGGQGVTRLILNWSPLGLFYRAFAGVMRYFGVSLPKNFSDFGSMLIDGLVGGIKAKLTAARDSIVSFGNSIKGIYQHPRHQVAQPRVHGVRRQHRRGRSHRHPAHRPPWPAVPLRRWPTPPRPQPKAVVDEAAARQAVSRPPAVAW